MPLISVLLPVYNGAAFITETLESILAQTYSNIEILAIDDGSHDETPDILERYRLKDSRVRVITKKNSGISDTLNEGIRLSAGRYIARIDADDLMLRHRLEQQVTFLETNRDLGFCSSAVQLIDGRGRAFGESRLLPATREELHAMIRAKLPISYTHPATMFRRSALDLVGGYDRRCEPVEDLDLFYRLTRAGKVGLVMPETLTAYRIHSKSISGSSIQRQIWMRDFVTSNFYRALDHLAPLTVEDFEEQSTLSLAGISRHARMKSEIHKQMALFYRADRHTCRELFHYSVAAMWQPASAIRRALRHIGLHIFEAGRASSTVTTR